VIYLTEHVKATLTDIRYKMNGKTVLYIPEEKRVPEKPSEAMQDKELVSRLETTMIHWTRQIKEVLSAQEAVETNENAGPLEEIQFWQNRCADLSGLSKQLDLPGVKKVEEILAAAKSSYVQSFRKISEFFHRIFQLSIARIYILRTSSKIHSKKIVSINTRWFKPSPTKSQIFKSAKGTMRKTNKKSSKRNRFVNCTL